MDNAIKTEPSFMVAKNSTAGDNLQTTDAEIMIKIESKHWKEQIQKVQMWRCRETFTT